ncbi:ribosomal protein S18-alanine N-acetyltransferase [Chitinibacter sp. S2-10]|uniref:ribosomal protein S18-alanine N-acetyltransferase n=1 Tax=Chitinibacter sp. S2-10 TaxID=3373597 RepID=UPI003977B27E
MNSQPAQPSFSRLSDIHVAALAELDDATNPHPWSGKQWLDSLSQHECFGVWQVQGNEATLAGFIVCMATLDEAEILLIAVAPQHQRQGLGTQLLQYAETTLAREGVQKLFLEVRDSNVSARAFYCAHGWQETGRRKNYYRCEPENGQNREDAILCSKTLTLTEAPQ